MESQTKEIEVIETWQNKNVLYLKFIVIKYLTIDSLLCVACNKGIVLYTFDHILLVVISNAFYYKNSRVTYIME